MARSGKKSATKPPVEEAKTEESVENAEAEAEKLEETEAEADQQAQDARPTPARENPVTKTMVINGLKSMKTNIARLAESELPRLEADAMPYSQKARGCIDLAIEAVQKMAVNE